jgi:hypothetical protein
VLEISNAVETACIVKVHATNPEKTAIAAAAAAFMLRILPKQQTNQQYVINT